MPLYGGHQGDGAVGQSLAALAVWAYAQPGRPGPGLVASTVLILMHCSPVVKGKDAARTTGQSPIGDTCKPRSSNGTLEALNLCLAPARHPVKTQLIKLERFAASVHSDPVLACTEIAARPSQPNRRFTVFLLAHIGMTNTEFTRLFMNLVFTRYALINCTPKIATRPDLMRIGSTTSLSRHGTRHANSPCCRPCPSGRPAGRQKTAGLAAPHNAFRTTAMQTSGNRTTTPLGISGSRPARASFPSFSFSLP